MVKFPKHKQTILHFALSFCILIFAFFITNTAHAAKLFFEPSTAELGISNEFEVTLLLDTENEEINALEGKVIFPGDLLELKEIRDGNSIINFWVERPIVGLNNQIIFSGIIPGGYLGQKGLIFSVIFQSKNEGKGIIEIYEAKAFFNDGKGTQAKTEISNLQFLISKDVSGFEFETLKDTEPPEDFKPQVARDSTVFDGRWFLVFATQDKGMGIDHYEILEESQRGSLQRLFQKEKWQVGESPYLLKDQKLKSYIYVKAIDKAGNERIATIPPHNPLKWYENYENWIMVIIGIITIFVIFLVLWVRNSKIKYQKSK